MRTGDLLARLSLSRLRDLAATIGVALDGDHDELRHRVQRWLHDRSRSDGTRAGWRAAGLWVIQRMNAAELCKAIDVEWWGEDRGEDPLFFTPSTSVESLLEEELRFLLAKLYVAVGEQSAVTGVCSGETWRRCFSEQVISVT